jgi:hypothetical protein
MVVSHKSFLAPVRNMILTSPSPTASTNPLLTNYLVLSPHPLLPAIAMAPPRASRPHSGTKSSRRHPLEGYHNINVTAETMKDLDGSASHLAGAMGLEGSYQLHRLFSKTCAATQRVIADFVKDRQNDFGHAHLPKNLCIVQAHNITNAVEHAGEFTLLSLQTRPRPWPPRISHRTTSSTYARDGVTASIYLPVPVTLVLGLS